MKILKDGYKEAKRLLKDNRKVMDELAAFLIQKETITGKEFMKIFRKIKGIPEPEETTKENLKEKKKEIFPLSDKSGQAADTGKIC